jgi:hypothetical protein
VGTTYKYRVRSYNGNGYSSYSNVASAVVPATPPVPPTMPVPGTPTTPSPLSPTAGISINGVLLSWAAAANATAYDLYLGTSSNPPLFRANLAGTSQSSGALMSGANYYWRVVAKNSGGQKSGPVWFFSAEVRVKPGNRNH